MKKVLSLFLVASLIIGLGSCTKEAPNQGGQNPFYVPGGNTGGGTDPEPTPGIPVGDVPASFTQKVVLEENTGEWCGWCPEGAEIMDNEIAANPNAVIGIAIHDGDPMEVAAYNTWHKSFTGVGGFPNGNVSRRSAAGRGSWSGSIAADLAQTADLGLAMVTSESGGLLDVDVYVGYNAPISGDTKISIVITEDDVPQSSPGAQSNYSSTTVVDPNTWTHGHVFRGVITANEGDAIDLTSSEKMTLVSFKGVDLSGMKIGDMSKVHVVAYVNVNSGSTNPAANNGGKWTLNAQQATLNEIKKWD
jgi:hypothetical protein